MKGATQRVHYPHFPSREQAMTSQLQARVERNIALANELRGLVDQAQETAREAWALLNRLPPNNQ